MIEMVVQRDHYVIWLLTTILAAKIGVVRVAIRVAVLKPAQSYQDGQQMMVKTVKY